MALAVSICTTSCERWGSVCLSMGPDCDADPDAPSPGIHLVSPRTVCTGERAELLSGYFVHCGSSRIDAEKLVYESSDPSVLRIEGGEAIGVSAGRAKVHVQFTDGSGSASGDVQVVLCEDAGSDTDSGNASDAATDVADDS